jgi:hypothetical protein
MWEEKAGGIGCIRRKGRALDLLALNFDLDCARRFEIDIYPHF